MTLKIIESVRRLQQHLIETGLARGVVAHPAPRMLSSPSPTGEEATSANVFAATITEAEIERVSRDLFASGHYSFAVQEAYKAVEKYIIDKAGQSKVVGTQLMELVFSPNAPVLFWTERRTTSEQDEQKGYQRLYAGAMLGIRNPVTHESGWIEDAQVALELLVFAQHLLRKAKTARLGTALTEARSSASAA